MVRRLAAVFVVVNLLSACARKAPTTAPPAPPAAPSTAAPNTRPPAGLGQKEQTSQSGSGNTTIQFDAAGVDVARWVDRFTAQIRRNWFVPLAAMTEKGRVVVTFYVWKDGRITDVTVTQPSAVESFNRSAQHAIVSSNPTIALPPDYPHEKAFFTLTFYFNEAPPPR